MQQQSQRQLRVGEQIRHALAESLRDASYLDPDLEKPSLVTVTEVRISPDLKNATAYVMPLGGKDVEKTVAALNRTAGYFRSEIGRRVDLRHTPRIAFIADESFDNAAHIDRLLQDERVQRDLKKADEEE